jgi:hypothetical protein
MPRPGFSIYRTLGAGYGINAKFYNLLVRFNGYVKPLMEWNDPLNDMEPVH